MEPDGLGFSRSILYGRGVYRWDSEMVVDPFDPSGAYTPILTNALTEEKYFVRKLDGVMELTKALSKRVLRPPATDLALWPSDLVQLPDEVASRCNSSAYHEYMETPTSPLDRGGSYGLLFSADFNTTYKSLGSQIDLVDELSWRDPNVRSIAVSLARAFDRLNSSGYVFVDVSLDRLFLTPNNEAYFDFSPLCVGIDEVVVPCKGSGSEALLLKSGQYPIEFAEPALVSGKVQSIDFRMQNYSLSALLLFLLMGQYAYDGPLLMGYSDNTLQEHYIKFREYHKMPIFVFDSVERENSLGTFAEDLETIELWNSMPKALRSALEKALTRSNALRLSEDMSPTAGMWLRIFDALGWSA